VEDQQRDVAQPDDVRRDPFAPEAIDGVIGYPARMQMYEAVLKMRESLLQQGITLVPEVPDGRQQYERVGPGAWQAWQAFRAIAAEPAYDAVEGCGGETMTVIHAGFQFEAGFSKGWSAQVRGGRDVGEHYSLSIIRHFGLGEYGMLRGLDLTIEVSAADELRDRQASLFGGEGDAADVRQWLDEVEAHPAFRIPMTRHPAERFAFGVVSIG
jgi:hypothetical protein